MKNFAIWAVIFLGITFLSNVINNAGNKSEKIIFSEFVNKVEKGEVATAQLQSNSISGEYKNGISYQTTTPTYYPEIVTKLLANNLAIEVKSNGSISNILLSIFISWFPILLLIGVWLYFARSMGKGKGGAGGFSFGKSKAKLFEQKNVTTTFHDIAGIEEAKKELFEIVDFLKSPDKFLKLGAKIPKGCLLLGNPGTGKTLLAKAIAGEAKVPFFSMSGSDFVEMFVGVGASRVRDLFEQAKKHSPSIIFIDEIDAVGRHRGSGVGGGNDEREQTLNQLLVEMDGFEINQNVIVVAATNRADVLDKALLRPGRFDRQITVPNPDVGGRENILNVHIKKVPCGPNVNTKVLARGTPGFSGAELANIVNEAALYAAKYNKKIVTMEDFEYAKDKVMMGIERTSMAMKDEEKKLTAYHEAGHALAGIYSEGSDPIHKATIIPRGQALGMVMRLPEDDRYSVTRMKLKADLVVAMAGRVAEEMIFGYDFVTTGASSDIDYATSIARSMVQKWGLNDTVGPVKYNVSQDEFISNDIANLIDKEVRCFITQAYDDAKKLLKKHEKELHLLAQALIEYETLTGAEINEVIQGKKIRMDQKNSSKNEAESNKPLQSSFDLDDKKSHGEKSDNASDDDSNNKETEKAESDLETKDQEKQDDTKKD